MHILAIDIFVLTQMILEINEVQGSNGFSILGSDLLHQPTYLEIQACYSETLYQYIVPLLEVHILAIDIFVLTQMILEINEVQGSNGFSILGSDLLHQPTYLEIQACYVETLL